MKRFSPAGNLLAAIVALAACTAAPTATPTYTTLFNFDNTDGGFPHGDLAIGPNGVLYGTTQGGAYGEDVRQTVRRLHRENSAQDADRRA